MKPSITIEIPNTREDHSQTMIIAFTSTSNPVKLRMWQGGEDDDKGTCESPSSNGSSAYGAPCSPLQLSVPNRYQPSSGESDRAASWELAFTPKENKAAPLEACPLKEGCFCAKGNLVRHLIHDHKMKTTPLDSEGRFRMKMTFSLSNRTKRFGVVLELEDGRQHLLWLFERSGGSESGTMDIRAAVYTLPDYRGPRLSVRIACSKTEDCVEKMVWTGQLQRLRDTVRPSTMRLRYPESDCFGRGSRNKLVVLIDTTFENA